MASVNMSNVNFYNPNTVLKPPPHKQPAFSTLNKHQQTIQPIMSQHPAPRNVRDVDLSDDSLPSLSELLRPSRNVNTPQISPQNWNLLHRSKQELAGDSRPKPTTPNSIYKPGNSQRR